MSMSRTSLVLLAFVAACNAVYGLDETRPRQDADGDGHFDSADNCPTIANPDQLDTFDDEGGDACAQCPVLIGIDLDDDLYDDGCDRCLGPGFTGDDVDRDDIDDGCDPCIGGKAAFEIDFNENGIGDGCEVCFEPPLGDVDVDGLDDACDSCLRGPPHDEDGDGLDDACDNCPFDPNPDQAPPGASVGAACTRDAIALFERTLFDPFLVRDIRWVGVAGSWVIDDDRASVTSGGQRTIGARFGGEFRLVTRVRLGPSAAIDVELRASPTEMVACRVEQSGEVTFDNERAAITNTDEPITIELYRSDASLGIPLRCVVTAGDESVLLKTDQATGKDRVTLRATGAVAIDAVDFVTPAPLTTTN